MTRVKIITTSIGLIASCAGLVFLGSATLRGAPQAGVRARPSPPSQRLKAMKYTWHSGPASSPLETELVPPSPPAAPPVTSLVLKSHAERKMSATASPAGALPAVPVRATKGIPAAALAQASPTSADQHGAPDSPAPEAQRVQDELKHLHYNSKAREAFYDDLRRTVQEVRAAAGSSDSDVDLH
jgi:hypothetical protein